MSALDDQPKHFLRWAQANYDSAIGPQSFLPQRIYEQYIAALLLDAAPMRPGRFSFKHDEAVSVETEDKRGVVWLRSGDAVVGDKIVLALGNFPPGNPKLPGSRYIALAMFPMPGPPALCSMLLKTARSCCWARGSLRSTRCWRCGPASFGGPSIFFRATVCFRSLTSPPLHSLHSGTKAHRAPHADSCVWSSTRSGRRSESGRIGVR
jgi:hypothetical protein